MPTISFPATEALAERITNAAHDARVSRSKWIREAVELRLLEFEARPLVTEISDLGQLRDVMLEEYEDDEGNQITDLDLDAIKRKNPFTRRGWDDD